MSPPPAAEDVTALVLAGGRSSRFGSDKTRHPVGGTPMAERAASLAAPFAGRVLVGVARRGDASPVPGLPTVHDLPQGVGPLGGLAAGFAAARTPWLLVMACDLPRLHEGSVRALLDAARPGVSVVSRAEAGRLQPLFALYDVGVSAAVGELIAAGNRRVMDLLVRISFEEVVLSAREMTNVNRPEDLWS